MNLRPLGAIVGLALSGILPAQEASQSITLNPGWNAVWVEVQPEANTPAEVFAGIPVESVWTWLDPESPAEFIQSVSEAAFKAAGWQRWFPQGRPESILTNLFRIQANRAYLIKLGGAAPVEWTFVGRPSLRRPAWAPDAFSLRGLPVDPASPPTFGAFFGPSPAHFDEAAGSLQPIYRLDRAQGRWEAVAAGDPIASGEAYWIHTEGASDYQAPLEVRVELGDGLDFGETLATLNLHLRSHRDIPANAILREQSVDGASVLSYEIFDTEQGTLWPPLPSPHGVPLDPSGEVRLRLAVRRQDQSQPLQRSLLEVTDGAGTRILVPTRSEHPGLAEPAAGARSATTDPAAGLWVGEVTLQAVSEAHTQPDGAPPTPVDNEFRLRAILHVDATGQVRLLREVIQMFREGTTRTGENGTEEVETPGEFVLLTRHELVPQFQGAALRDGEPVGRRVSTIGFDFAPPGDDPSLPLSGALAVGQTVSGTLDLPADHPTNPFLHRYHPDHDNLDPRYEEEREEAFAVQREIAFEFLAAPPEGPTPPDFGYDSMAGNYRETITGIHRKPIRMAGSFRLERVSAIDVLDPQP